MLYCPTADTGEVVSLIKHLILMKLI